MRFGGLFFSTETQQEVVSAISLAKSESKFVSIVTPNIAHLATVQRDPSIAMAWNSATFVLPDGWPVAVALRSFYGDVRGRITGADLSLAVMRQAELDGLSVMIIGGTDQVLEAAYVKAGLLFPALTLIRPRSNPRLPTIPTDESLDIFSGAIGELRPDILFICLGAPKSELHLLRSMDYLNTGVALCVGATVDFLAGTRRRAPRWVQSLGMEWLFRLLQEPRRLFTRYLGGGLRFLRIVADEVLARMGRPGGQG